MSRREGLSCITACNIVVLALTSQAVVGDLFTSVQDMEGLAQHEDRLMGILAQYISTQQARLDVLAVKLKQMSNIRPPWLKNPNLIADPVNAYSLVRRLTREWPLILNLMVNNIDIQDELSRLPREEDMESSVRAIARLQHVYSLDTALLAQERHLETWGYVALTALDCFEIGKYLFNKHNYEVSKSWFNEALEKIANKDFTVKQDQVLTHLFLATRYSDCKNGFIPESASDVLHYLMSQYPNYTLDKGSAPLFRQALSGNCSASHDQVDKELSDSYYSHMFSETCKKINSSLNSELRCFYITYNNPLLLIAPFKMEELHLDPPLLMFHDIISDQEIEDMKTAFTTVKARCATINDEDGVMNSENYYRQCDVGWILDQDLDTSARLTRRVGHMTNLFMGSSEFNQVASYGLGGEFLLHFDPISSETFPEHPSGGRIATLMFYMSDVESGGFTVFPTLNVTVTPEKGSAVFWFNLDHRSVALTDMLHGGCPVLRGSKWVLNKWIHEAGQNSEMICPADEIFPKKRYYLNSIN